MKTKNEKAETTAKGCNCGNSSCNCTNCKCGDNCPGSGCACGCQCCK